MRQRVPNMEYVLKDGVAVKEGRENADTAE